MVSDLTAISRATMIEPLVARLPFNGAPLLKMAGSGYRRFARSRLYEYILVVMRFYYCI